MFAVYQYKDDALLRRTKSSVANCDCMRNKATVSMV